MFETRNNQWRAVCLFWFYPSLSTLAEWKARFLLYFCAGCHKSSSVPSGDHHSCWWKWAWITQRTTKHCYGNCFSKLYRSFKVSLHCRCCLWSKVCESPFSVIHSHLFLWVFCILSYYTVSFLRTKIVIGKIKWRMLVLVCSYIWNHTEEMVLVSWAVVCNADIPDWSIRSRPHCPTSEPVLW